MLAALSCCGVLAALAGCGASSRKAGSEPLLTAVHDASVRERMARLEQLMVAELPDAMGSEQARREIARAARELEQEALGIPELAEDLDLSSDEKSHFYVIADSLAESARQLAVEAATGTEETVVARYRAIADSCVTCHNLFRALPGP
jgi:cytochrome c556